jgi:hypothetical protein
VLTSKRYEENYNYTFLTRKNLRKENMKIEKGKEKT